MLRLHEELRLEILIVLADGLGLRTDSSLNDCLEEECPKRNIRPASEDEQKHVEKFRAHMDEVIRTGLKIFERRARDGIDIDTFTCFWDSTAENKLMDGSQSRDESGSTDQRDRSSSNWSNWLYWLKWSSWSKLNWYRFSICVVLIHPFISSAVHQFSSSFDVTLPLCQSISNGRFMAVCRNLLMADKLSGSVLSCCARTQLKAKSHTS